MKDGMCVLIENNEKEITIPYLLLAEDLGFSIIDQEQLHKKIQQQTYEFAIDKGMKLNKNGILCDSEEKIHEVSAAINKKNCIERDLFNNYDKQAQE
ncbi:MAG: hypothetical protein E7050_04865 [Lentisphaerae bacterium]|nr:hypothetical protein [Lentisphaerota bacterium]